MEEKPLNINDGVILWGQVGVSKTLTIGENAVVLAQSGIPGNLEAGQVYFGSPAQDARTKQKELVWVKRIPELWAKVMGQKNTTDLNKQLAAQQIIARPATCAGRGQLSKRRLIQRLKPSY